MFFETPSLKNASPAFISKVGLVMTEDEDLEWQAICYRLKTLFFIKHKSFFTEQNLNGEKFITEFLLEFFNPFIDQLIKLPKFKMWPHFNVKSSIIQFFNLLNSIFYRFAEICKVKNQEDDGG